MYKIITKLLAERLKRVIGQLILETYTSFIPRRHILDGVLVINELLDLANREKKECLLFKVDFTQAYDCVSWGYLRYIF